MTTTTSSFSTPTTATCMGVAVLLAISLTACSSGGDQTAEREQSAVAEAARPNRASYTSHDEAAIAAALDAAPDLVEPAVTNAVVIFTNETTVDIRARVEAEDGYCKWFGVNGEVTATTINWHAGPASDCDT